MRVRVSATARVQLREAGEYVRRDNPTAARRFASRVGVALRRLRRFPRYGRLVPEFPGAGYREIIVAPYRVFYRVRDDEVLVLAIWHGAREPRRPG